MCEEQKIIKNKIINAYKKLLEKDLFLLDNNLNERTITYKFAQYLEKEFDDYDIDCEYNRNCEQIKQLEIINTASNDTDATTIYPDIIVHKRGQNSDNYIVIEAKKSNSHELKKENTVLEKDYFKINDTYLVFKNDKKLNDIEKLRLYKKELNYKFAYSILFLVEDFYPYYSTCNLSELIKEK